MAPHVDPQWLAQGACKQHPEIDFFAADEVSQREPLAICAGCAVRAPCLEYALSGHEFGVWGGTTERARARMRRSARRDRLGVLKQIDPAAVRSSSSGVHRRRPIVGDDVATAS